MSHDIRNWIAASLPKGYTAEQLRSLLARSGFPAEAVEKELALAATYITTVHALKTEGDTVQKKLDRREALLLTLDHQMRAMPAYLKPEKVRLPPFEQFLEEYYYPNRPGLFSNTLDNCEAKNWTPRTLADKIGADTIVEIQSDYPRNAKVDEQNDPKYRKKIKLGDFIGMVENPNSKNNFYMTLRNRNANDRPLRKLEKDIEDFGHGYLIPGDVASDSSLYFLIGPKGTVTSTHHDFVSNLFIQAYGRKLVRLVPALQAPYMYNNHSSDSDVDLLNPDFNVYPDFAKATVLEIEVGPGDCIFIPVGWWHHITSLTPSISLSCSNFRTIGPDNLFVDSKKLYS